MYRISYRFLVPGLSAKPLVSAHDRIMGTHTPLSGPQTWCAATSPLLLDHADAGVSAERPTDLVRRDFTAAAPNRLWVTDLTVAPTRTGAAYVCLIVDAFSRIIVGWRVAAHMRTEMVLDALEMARRSRGARIEGLTVHSDAGSLGGVVEDLPDRGRSKAVAEPGKFAVDAAISPGRIVGCEAQCESAKLS